MKLVDSSLLIPELNLWDKATSKWIKFILWPFQVLWIKALQLQLRLIALKKRQVGLSQLTGADSLIQCLFLLNFTVLVLSKTAFDAAVFLSRVREMWKQIPTLEEFKAMQDRGEEVSEHLERLVMAKEINPVIKGADAGDEMVFASGSKIVSLSAHKGRGMTADRVILDEAAFYTKAIASTTLAEVLKGVEPTLDRAGGQLIIISTAFGLGLFYDYYQAAKKKISSYLSFFASCWDDPDFTQKMRDQKEIDNGSDYVNQEYPRNDREAFLASGRPRFNLKVVSEHYDPLADMYPPIARGNIILTAEERQVVEVNPKGFMKFYMKRDDREVYAISADVATGSKKGAYSTAKVFLLRTMEQVATWHGHIEPEAYGKVLALLGRHYNNAILIPEANGEHGASCIQGIRNSDYPDSLIHVSKVKKKEHEQDKMLDPNARFGFWTTGATRPFIIDNYAYQIEQKTIPWIPLEDLEEIYTFIVNERGDSEADEGKQDDRVMAAAIGYFVGPKYVIANIPSWQICGLCQYWKQNDKEFGTCTKTQRYCSCDSWCRCFIQDRGIKDYNPANDPAARFKTGYRPAMKND